MNPFQIVQVIGQIVSEAEEITGDFISGVGDFISSSEEQELRNLYQRFSQEKTIIDIAAFHLQRIYYEYEVLALVPYSNKLTLAAGEIQIEKYEKEIAKAFASPSRMGMIAKLLPGVPSLTLRGYEIRQTKDLLKNGMDKLQQARADLIDGFTTLRAWFNQYLSAVADVIPDHDLSSLESIKVGIDELIAASCEIITSVDTNAVVSDEFEKLNSRHLEVFSRLSILIMRIRSDQLVLRGRIASAVALLRSGVAKPVIMYAIELKPEEMKVAEEIVQGGHPKTSK